MAPKLIRESNLTGTELLDPQKEYTPEEAFRIFSTKKSDVYEHLPTLRRFGSQVDHITEFGVRYGGTLIAWVLAKPKIIRAYENAHFRQFQGERFIKWCEKLGIDYKFVSADTTKTTIEPTDLLFIDTRHTYTQLKTELELHGSKVSKYIIFHDTVTFGKVGQDKKDKGILFAIDEFLAQHPQWQRIKSYQNCNGLLVIGKVSNMTH